MKRYFLFIFSVLIFMGSCKHKVNVVVTEGYKFTPLGGSSLSATNYQDHLNCIDDCSHRSENDQRELSKYKGEGFVIVNKMPQDTYSDGYGSCICTGQLYLLEK